MESNRLQSSNPLTAVNSSLRLGHFLDWANSSRIPFAHASVSGNVTDEADFASFGESLNKSSHGHSTHSANLVVAHVTIDHG